MTRIEMRCERCGAAVVSASAAEVIEWSNSHDAKCLGPKPS